MSVDETPGYAKRAVPKSEPVDCADLEWPPMEWEKAVVLGYILIDGSVDEIEIVIEEGEE